jgi:soluble lytic murein transglycosylase-like protein
MNLSALLCAAAMSLGMNNSDMVCAQTDIITQHSAEYDVRPEIIVALIESESKWNSNAVSRSGACGLTQVIPRFTGGRATGGRAYTCAQLRNPMVSIYAGISIFSYWLHNFGHCQWGHCGRRNYELGLCGYNAGYTCRGPDPSRRGYIYANTIIAKAEAIGREMRRIENAWQQGHAR